MSALTQYPDWATPGENRKLFGKAMASGAPDIILLDIDATIGFLEEKSGEYNSLILSDINLPVLRESQRKRERKRDRKRDRK